MSERDNIPEDPMHHLSEEEINSPEFDPEDFAPAPETPEDGGAAPHGKAYERRAAMFYSIMAAVFAVLIAVAGIFGSSGFDSAEDGMYVKKVMSCYENCSDARYYDTVEGSPVYAVLYRDALAGYAVFKTAEGFGGDIEILICFNTDDEVCRVKITGENESDGLGDKIRKDSFTSQFNELSTKNVEDINMNIDFISGATVSSRAVRNAVRDVVQIGFRAEAIAEKMGIDISNEDASDTDTDDDADHSSDSTDERGSETTKRDTDDGDDSSRLDGEGGSPNVNNGGGDMDVDVSDVTTVYDTETEEDDTTEPETTAPVSDTKDTSAAPVVTDPPVTSAAPVTTDPPVSDTGDTSSEETDDTEPEPVDNSQAAAVS